MLFTIHICHSPRSIRSKENEFRTYLRKEGGDTLNVYMCDLLSGQDRAGYAYYPMDTIPDYVQDDGVAIMHPFARGHGYTMQDLYMTMVHEAGHWMGLYHTFNGGNCQVGDAVAGKSRCCMGRLVKKATSKELTSDHVQTPRHIHVLVGTTTDGTVASSRRTKT